MYSRRKKLIIIIAVICIIALIFIYRNFGLPLLASYKYSSVSPDGKYELDVYSEPMFFAMPGGGGAGSHTAIVILRNSWGREIGANYGCVIFMDDDVNIEWYSDKNYVDIAKVRSIDLNTGRCEQ